MFAVVIAVGLLSGLAAPSLAEERSPAIEEVISSQIRAFLSDDFVTAFTFASPDLQRLFRTPERFGAMVMNGYPMVWRPSKIEFMSLENINGQLVQRVLIADAQGSYFVAEYTMIKGEDGWQIRGVRIERAAEMSV
ncbi:MAG: DUF4864 domain-containing protein [Alphaproteobacteria bacterium]|nr:DUF4864 domain-containing protein [Alphaproteobacteria bacterium]